ncbi:MAG: hypothetical protein FWF44_09390, partial [Defluviitaleaceae bacterium]|nr:hypothetical protein [Defluviitaleaceae bacterium]
PSLYKEPGLPDNGQSVIWILDYVGGDTTAPSLPSIGDSFDPSVLITANITDDTIGANAQSYGKHPYCGAGSYGSSFNINSARHLYNIRYVLDNQVNDITNGKYTQSGNIALNDPGVADPNSKVTNFAPIPDFKGIYNGGGNTLSYLAVDCIGKASDAGLFTSVAAGSEVKNVVLASPNVRGDKNAGAICGASAGAISSLTISNPEVLGGENTGAVCGINSGAINVAYVKFDYIPFGVNTSPEDYIYIKTESMSRAIGGAGNTGGIAGANSGEIKNTTFISPCATVHVEGGTVGGITGDNTGKLDSILFLALSPKDANGDIVPITHKAGEGVSNAYYLSGGPIHANEDELALAVAGGLLDMRDGFNREKPSAEPGVGMTTWEMYCNAAIPGWTRDTRLTEEAQVDPRNDGVYLDYYPYPYIDAQSAVLPGDPDWPVAGGGPSAAELEYYEFYQTGSPVYALYPDFGGSTLPGGSIVTHDGYSFRMTLPDSSKTLTLIIGEDDPVDIICTYAAGKKSVKTSGDWPVDIAPADIIPGENETWARIYIPNSVFEAASQGERVEIALMDGADPVFDRTINPMFAQGRNDIIRSPRQLDNIDISAATLGGSYTQQLPLDFSKYYKGMSSDIKPEREPQGKDFSKFSEPVVGGSFTGTYKGGNLKIQNVTIDAPSTDNVGLFSANSGTIQNISVSGAKIDGGANTGGVAGTNYNIISNAALTSSQITGAGSYAGGVAGRNSGNISAAAIQSASITGNIDYTGGVAGANSGAISNSTLTSPIISGGNNTGGVAGTNSGTISNSALVSPSISGGNYTGGVAGTNSGGIDTVKISPDTVTQVSPTITGRNNTGGVAGTNSSGKTIQNVNIDYAIINGDNNTGGVAGDNSGNVYAATLQTPVVTGAGDNTGGAAGTNSGTLGRNSGAALRGVNISLVEPLVTGANNAGGVAGANTGTGTITDCRVYSKALAAGARISGISNVGGIAGSNANSIAYSYIGIDAGKPLGDLRVMAEPNRVLGGSAVGGVAGTSSGRIEVCYTDYTQVGTDSSSVRVGGIVGALTGGVVQNVFFNYGNAAPQIWSWVLSILGAPATSGGIVGTISGGTVASAYSDAYIGLNNNFIAGNGAAANLPASVLFLKQVGYNTGA